MDKIPITGNQAKDDLLNCIIQLGERAAELGEKNIAGMLYVVGAAVLSKEYEEACSSVLKDFAEVVMYAEILKSNEDKTKES